jgi:hypothetical protein
MLLLGSGHRRASQSSSCTAQREDSVRLKVQGRRASLSIYLTWFIVENNPTLMRHYFSVGLVRISVAS